MKSKEEIEDIANKEYGEYAGYHKASFTNGYTKCQEDMAKRIMDLENILHTICTWCNPHDSSHENIWRIAYNSLNKKD